MLSWLTLAYELGKKDIHPLVPEASCQIGDKIHTEKRVHGKPLELGATWLADDNKCFQLYSLRNLIIV